MARSRFCRVCHEFHDLAQAWPRDCYGHFGEQAQDPRFYVQSDTIEPFRSMADNRMYDSKSRYRADLKARGMIEVGNEVVEHRPAPMPPVKQTLREVYHRLSNG